jgi:hypothetical protein
MKIILDECVPLLVKKGLPDHDITTVQLNGWSGIKNGELLRRVAAQFDVFITSDKNLRHQQNLTNLEVSIVLLPSNQVPVITALLPDIREALEKITHRQFVEI